MIGKCFETCNFAYYQPLQVIKLKKSELYIYWKDFINTWKRIPCHEYLNPNTNPPFDLIQYNTQYGTLPKYNKRGPR